MSDKKTLEDLKKPFSDNEIGKLPKPTKQQTLDAKSLSWAEKQCKICGGVHHPRVVHLDYVGHAALTKRLLEVDPTWNWEPMALVEGLPAFDKTGGLWIKLTVLGVTRLGYGNAALASFKDIGSREKEVIGDALRNAGMRFGMALDLWHKGDLQLTDEAPEPEKELPKPKPKTVTQPAPKKKMFKDEIDKVFDNPNEVLVDELWKDLRKENAPKKAMDYFEEFNKPFQDSLLTLNNAIKNTL